MGFQVVALVANLFVIGGALWAIREFRPSKRVIELGYWFNAQEWGARNEKLSRPSCWTRILPRPVCRMLAEFILSRVEEPPLDQNNPHAELEHTVGVVEKILRKWHNITDRHIKRGWNRHPSRCSNPLLERYCKNPRCSEIATYRVTSSESPSVEYYCSEHGPDGPFENPSQVFEWA